MMTKEDLYDTHISPLMAQIIALCKEHKIAVYAAFDLADEDNDDLGCTTYIHDDTTLPAFLEKHSPLMRKLRPVAPVDIITRNGDGQITEWARVVG